MKMRQHKRRVMARQLFPWGAAMPPRWWIREESDTPLGDLLQRKLKLQALVEDLSDMAPEYQCIRVKDGVIVDTFKTRSEALALVLKHAKQRKAKLQVLNTASGELELFYEEEVA